MPSALRIEETKMIIRQMGAIYFIIMTNNFSRLNGPFNFTSSITIVGLEMYPIKIQVRNATIGIKILLLIKSKNVRKSIPNGIICPKTPNPKEDGIANEKENKVITIIVSFLSQ